MGLFDADRNHQSAENQKARTFEVEMLGRQNALNIEQWERENEYNLPVNQIARLKQAGLNPDLAYGQLGSAGLVAAKSPEMRMDADYHPVDYASLSQAKTQKVQAIMNAAQEANQIIRSSFENRNIAAQTRSIEIDNQLKAPRVPLAKETADWELKNLKQDYFTSGAQQTNYLSSASNQDAQAAFYRAAEGVKHLEGLKLEAEKPYFDRVAKAAADSAEAQYILTLGNIFNVVSDAELKQAQRAYWEKNREMLEKLMTYQDYMNDMESMRKDLLGVIHGNVMSDPRWFKTMQRIQSLTSAIGAIFSGAGTTVIGKMIGGSN